jgi:hypothetical protein
VADPIASTRSFTGHAFTRLLGECLGKSPPDLTVPEDILLHGDREAGGFDCLEHRGIKLFAIVVDLDAVSFDQRRSGHSGDGRVELSRLRIEVRVERLNGGMWLSRSVIQNI